MKKLIIVVLLLFTFNVYAKEEVKLDKCVDGDTAWFIYNNKSSKFRFLAIDTPESTNKIEEFGKEASKYTCNKLMQAKKIEIEFDSNSDKKDKYERYLAWIFVDDKLLQKEIIRQGYAEVKYIYGNYKYVDELKKEEKIAKKNKVGIYSEYKNDNNLYITVIIIIIVVLLFILIPSSRNKIIKRAKKEIKKSLKI